MAWSIEYSDTARRQLRKLDRQTARRILDYVDEHIATLENPRERGEPLNGPLGTFWRYRIGKYRLVWDIQDAALLILVVRLGKRSEVYR